MGVGTGEGCGDAWRDGLWDAGCGGGCCCCCPEGPAPLALAPAPEVEPAPPEAARDCGRRYGWAE